MPYPGLQSLLNQSSRQVTVRNSAKESHDILPWLAIPPRDLKRSEEWNTLAEQQFSRQAGKESKLSRTGQSVRLSDGCCFGLPSLARCFDSSRVARRSGCALSVVKLKLRHERTGRISWESSALDWRSVVSTCKFDVKCAAERQVDGGAGQPTSVIRH